MDNKKIYTIGLLILFSINNSINIIYASICISDPILSPNKLQLSNANQFNHTKAYRNIETQLNFGYRIPGTKSNQDCQYWIYQQMKKYGSTNFINFTIHNIPCAHILTKMNPGGDNIIILAAHYDSRAVAEKDANNSLQTNPILGANDGASGVAVLIEMARIMDQYPTLNNNEFWFLFIDAEDQGRSRGMYGLEDWDWCEGSEWFASELRMNPEKYLESTQELSILNAFILLDMVGGINLQFVKESHSNIELHKAIFKTGKNLGYTTAFPENPIKYTIIDDHVPFSRIGIPTVDLIIPFADPSSGWPYHHTHGDNLDHIDPQSLKITGQTVLTFLEDYYILNSSNTPLWKFFNPIPLFDIDPQLKNTIVVIGMFMGVVGLTFIWYHSKQIKLRKNDYESLYGPNIEKNKYKS